MIRWPSGLPALKMFVYIVHSLNPYTCVYCIVVVKDFDDWDDVGLNISKPPGLLYLFREYSNHAMSDQEQLNCIPDLVGVATCSRWVGRGIFNT